MATYSGTPKTWTAGETLLASDFNAEIRDPIAALSGAWTPYTPTLTGFTQGNGTFTAGYIQVGKFVSFWAKFILGSTSVANTAYPEISVPVALSLHPGLYSGYFYDTSSSSAYLAIVTPNLSTTVRMGIVGTNGLRTLFSASAPFTWAAEDQLVVSGTYEAA